MLPTYASAATRRDSWCDRRCATISGHSGRGLADSSSSDQDQAGVDSVVSHARLKELHIFRGVAGTVQTRHYAPRQLGNLSSIQGFKSVNSDTACRSTQSHTGVLKNSINTKQGVVMLHSVCFCAFPYEQKRKLLRVSFSESSNVFKANLT